MQYVATIQVDQSQYVSRITDLFIGETAAGKVLVSASYKGAGLASFSIAGAEVAATPRAVKEYPGGFGHWGDPTLQLLTIDGSPSLTLAGMNNAARYFLPLTDDGGMGPLRPVFPDSTIARNLLQIGQIEAGPKTFVYTARPGEVEFDLYRQDAQGNLTWVSRSEMPLAANMPEAQLDRMITVQMDGRPVIVAISGLGNFLSSHRLDAQGRIIRADYLKSRDGTGFNVPDDVAAVTVNGIVYLIVTSAQSSSITTIRLLPDGSMIPIDHVVDELTTRFQGATALATVEVDGRAFVFVGGHDDGISMFSVLPDGKLLHVETLADDNLMTLTDVSAIAADVIDGKIVLFVASASETGVTQLVVDPGQIGLTAKAGAGVILGTDWDDMLRAGHSTTQIKGGAGDDVLVTYRGDIMLWGGAGRDVFVATPVAGRILIWDFEAGVDRLDLSQLGMIRSTAQLKFSPFSKGMRIRFGDTLIELHSTHGGPLTAEEFNALMFPITHYLPPDVETVIVGSWRNDLIFGARGGSDIFGQGGNDVLLGGAVEDRLMGGAGHDTMTGGMGDDTLQGGSGNDRLRGSGGNDRLGGEAGHDMLIGDLGNDDLRGSDGNDTLFGGVGNDLLLGGSRADYLSGDANNDTLQGEGGNDFLSGGEGNDRLFDLSGDNRMAGGGGDDTLIAGAGADSMTGGGGHDLISSGSGNDTIEAGMDNDTVRAGAGGDFISGYDGNDGLYGDAGNDVVDGERGDDTLDGGMGDDTLSGGGENDLIRGRSGADLIYGGSGDDQIFGDVGDDLISGGSGNDQVFGGAGNDTIFGIAGENFLDGGSGDDLIQGDQGADQSLGRDGNDTIFGHGGDDRLDGGGNDDLVFAGAGQDDLQGGEGQDLLFGGAGDDSLQGQAGHDYLAGDADQDLLSGGDGMDHLDGGDGNDLLDGGLGADLLLGGAGADRFVFNTAADSTPFECDRIGDFERGIDQIDISALGLTFIGDQAFSGAGQLRATQLGENWLLLADLDGDAQADLMIRVDGSVPISADDLLL